MSADDNASIVDDPFILELRKDFLTEVAFLLEECEESFLKLEESPDRGEELKKIFRLAHSIKGSGTAVGYHDLAHFAHAVEDLLAILRVHPDCLTTEISSLLLVSNDAFKERIRQFQAGIDAKWDVSQLHADVTKMTDLLKVQLEGAAPEAAAPVVNEHTREGSVQMNAELSSGVSASESVPAEINVAEMANAASTLPLPSEVNSTDIASSDVAPAEIVPAEVAVPLAAAPAEAQAAKKPAALTPNSEITTIKVDVARLEGVLDLVGELVVIKSQLAHNPTIAGAPDNELKSVVNLLEKTVRELQEQTLAMRMTSLKPLFLKVQRVIRDLSVKLGKPVDFRMEGDDVEMDRTMIEVLTDPMIHLARNAIDHGVESPERRAASGKAPIAKISLVARQANGRVVIELKDDGGGIRKQKVLDHAKGKGLVSQDLQVATTPEREIFEMLFLPGFSTAEKVTDVSGRGVGLDVVKSNIEKIRGMIDIESIEGAGSIFRLSLPLTTAITDGLLTSLAGQCYIMPLTGIREIVRLDEKPQTRLPDATHVIEMRGSYLPLVDLEVLLGRSVTQSTEGGKSKGAAIITEHMGQTFAFKVDQVLGRTQVVVKGLGSTFDATSGVGGGAILGDGCVALVLDLEGLVRGFRRTQMKAA